MTRVTIEFDLEEGYEMVPKMFVDGERKELLGGISFDWRTADDETEFSAYCFAYKTYEKNKQGTLTEKQYMYGSPFRRLGNKWL